MTTRLLKVPENITGNDGGKILIAVSISKNNSMVIRTYNRPTLQNVAVTITHDTIGISGKYAVRNYTLVYQTSGFYWRVGLHAPSAET